MLGISIRTVQYRLNEYRMAGEAAASRVSEDDSHETGRDNQDVRRSA